ncbi:MAG: T9SS type A sorting domain-containing protein [bacterium]|nr:T9SS type A sorting domain-containing protein [bacterium]
MKKNILFLTLSLCFILRGNSQEIAQRFCETDGVVNTTLKMNDKVYIGGNFNYVGKTTGSFGGFSSTDANSIVLPVTLDGNIQTLATDNAGKIYVGGNFNYLGQQKYFLVFNADFTLASSPTINVNGPVKKIEISGNTLVMAGSFTSVNTQNRLGMAAVNLSTNSLEAFAPNPDGPVNDFKIAGTNVYIGGAFGFIAGGLRNSFALVSLSNTLQSMNLPINGMVKSMDLADSLIFIGGAFDSVAGVSRNNLASINTTSQSLRIWNIKTDGAVNAIKIIGSNLYFGGAFYTLNTNTFRLGYASADVLTGTVSNTDLAFDAPIEKIEVTNGQLYVYGDFSSIGSTNKKYVAAITTGGSIISTPMVNNKVKASLMIGSNIYLAGQFSSLGGKKINNIAALDFQTGNLINYPVDINGEVRQITRVGSELLIAGDFTSVNTLTRVGIAIIDTINGAPTNFDAALNGYVYSTTVNGSNLYLAGEFTQVGDSLRNNLASYNLNSNQLNSWNPNVNGKVSKMVLYGPYMYIGGDFSEVSGVSKKFIASFNLANNGLLRSWNINLDSNVSSITPIGNQVLVTGIFTSVNSNQRSPAFLADTATGTLSSWNPQFFGNPSSSYAENNLVFLGGSINSQNNNGLLVFNATTASEIDFPVKLAEGTLSYIGKFEDKLTFGGDFKFANANGKRNFGIVDFSVNTPTQQATQVTFSAVSPISAKIHISKGNGAKRIVLVKLGAAVDSNPLNGNAYEGNSAFGSGQFIGTNSVVYVGTDTTFELTALSNSTTYHVAVFEFNGFSSYTNYNTGTPATGNFTTSMAFFPPTTSASNVAFSDMRVNSGVIKWTKGNGEKRVVVLRENSAVNQTPTDSTQYYANSEMGSGSDLGTSNYVVYNGDGDSCVLSNLSGGKTYHASVFEYNGPDQLSRFKVNSPAVGNATTLSMASKPTIPATGLSVTNIVSDEITLSWTNGGGASRIVIASESQTVSTMPIDGQLYFSDNYFNGVSSYLSNNERVVYVGSSNTVVVKGLNQMTKYFFTVIEYNGGLYTSSYQPLGIPSASATTKPSVGAPVNPSKNITFTDKGTDYLSLKWQKGSGEKRLVVVKDKLNAGTFPNQGSLYNASNIFEMGDSLDDGSFVIGNTNIDSMTVIGLEANKTYYFAVYEFNESAFGGIYLTDSFAFANTKTSPNVGLKKLSGQSFKIYPNPISENRLLVQTEKPLLGNEKFEVKDLTGKTLNTYSQENWILESPNTIRINLEKHPKGIYLVTYTNEKGSVSLKFNID